MIKHRSITLRILDALAKTSHVGMTYPQIVRLAWRLSHPYGPKFDRKIKSHRDWWSTNLRGSVCNHVGLLNAFAHKVTLGGKTRWHRNHVPCTVHPWIVIRHLMPIPRIWGADPRQ